MRGVRRRPHTLVCLHTVAVTPSPRVNSCAPVSIRARFSRFVLLWPSAACDRGAGDYFPDVLTPARLVLVWHERRDKTLYWRNNLYSASDYYAVQPGGGPVFRSSSYSPTEGSAWTIGTNAAAPAPSSVPEIDPATGGSALSLVGGALAMIEQRRRRRGTSIALTP